MIIEKAVLTVEPGKEAAFQAAFFKAEPFVAAYPGCRAVHLYRCIEEPGRLMFTIEWESVAAHEEVFRKSPAFAE